MPNYQAQVTLFPASNVVADATVNTLSFAAADDTVLPNISNAIQTAYNGFVGMLPALVRQNGHVVKFYDRADPTPRAPVYEEVFNLTSAPTGNPLPPECALCVSFQANPVSGISQARRRGRVYLGPIDAAQVSAGGQTSTALVNAGVDWGQELLDASVAAADWEWCVWSTVDNAPYIITNGWVDNEFDTQRRRGRIATARFLFEI